MEMKKADLIDKASILRIKEEYGLTTEEEFSILMKEIAEQDMEDYMKLFNINRKIWGLEAQIGGLNSRIHKLNFERIDVKNQIAKKYGEYEEEKKY